MKLTQLIYMPKNGLDILPPVAILGSGNYVEPPAFEVLSQPENRLPPTPADLEIFGGLAIGNTHLLEPPSEIPRTHTVTNPSEEHLVPVVVGGEIHMAPLIYTRLEPIVDHLGNTVGRPYFLVRGRDGTLFLKPCDESDALEVVGEDVRVTEGVKMRVGNRVISGWLVSALQATPKPDNPHEVEEMRQVIYWGETLSQLEQIGEGPPGQKNITVAVANPCDADDTELDIYPRHQPQSLSGNIAYYRAKGPLDITPSKIAQADIIDDRVWPIGSGVWGGPNGARTLGPNHTELAVHDACSYPGPEGQDGRYYRLSRLGHDRTDGGLGRVVRLGAYASRDMFPAADPKPHAIYLGPVLYGGANGHRRFVSGVSDRWIGVADVHRTAAS